MYTLYEDKRYEMAVDDNENVGGVSEITLMQKSGLLRREIILSVNLSKEELKEMIDILQNHFNEKYNKK